MSTDWTKGRIEEIRSGPVAWIESFLDLNAEKVVGPPGRWRRVYREENVRTILRWADDRFKEEQRLRDLLSERFERNDARWNPRNRT